MRSGVSSAARNVPITCSSITTRFTRRSLGQAAAPPWVLEEHL
jgi:hypothetical protein